MRARDPGGAFRRKAMRKIVASAFISLDGVIQAPGGPEEDPTGGFRHEGWSTTLWDGEMEAAMGELFASPFDLLLGRRTYDIFAAHWPFVEMDPSAGSFEKLNADIAAMFNRVTKYVATHEPDTLTWANTEWLGKDVVARVEELKRGDGPVLLVQGSSVLTQQLLANDLIDEVRLLIYPLVLGKGKRFFGEGTIPAAFRLTASTTSPNGIIITRYERAGEVTTGSFGMETPTEAELERRRKLK
jgi:dihydrofolate reductase